MASLEKNKRNHSPKTQDGKKTNGTTSIFDYVKGSNIEIIVASLLLSGKLRFDSVQLFREASLIISLVGKYETLVDLNKTDIDRMVKLFKDNGNVSINAIIEEFQKTSKK